MNLSCNAAPILLARRWVLALLMMASIPCIGAPASAGVVCSFAPSQVGTLGSPTSTTKGPIYADSELLAGVGLLSRGQSLPRTIVLGPGGYITGSFASRIVTTVVVPITITIKGNPAIVKLACAPKDQPELVRQVVSDALDYWDKNDIGCCMSQALAGEELPGQHLEQRFGVDTTFSFSDAGLLMIALGSNRASDLFLPQAAENTEGIGTQEMTNIRNVNRMIYFLSDNKTGYVTIGKHRGIQVEVGKFCSDLCPDYTYHVFRYKLNEHQKCEDTGGEYRTQGTGWTYFKVCVPRPILDNWTKFLRARPWF